MTTLCAWCDREFEEDVIRYGMNQVYVKQTAEQQLNKHIRSKRRGGHGNLVCNNCKQPLSKCKDINGVTGSHQCIAAQIQKDAETMKGK